MGSSRAVSYGISIYERLHKALLSSVRFQPLGVNS